MHVYNNFTRSLLLRSEPVSSSFQFSRQSHPWHAELYPVVLFQTHIDVIYDNPNQHRLSLCESTIYHCPQSFYASGPFQISQFFAWVAKWWVQHQHHFPFNKHAGLPLEGLAEYPCDLRDFSGTTPNITVSISFLAFAFLFMCSHIHIRKPIAARWTRQKQSLCFFNMLSRASRLSLQGINLVHACSHHLCGLKSATISLFLVYLPWNWGTDAMIECWALSNSLFSFTSLIDFLVIFLP